MDAQSAPHSGATPDTGPPAGRAEDPGGTRDTGGGAGGPRGILTLLTGSMGLAMFVLFALGALAPLLVAELGISRAQLGALTAVGFGTAAALSLVSGHLTDRTGGRTALVALLVTVAAAFAVLAAGGAYGWMLLALVLAGGAQSLANPATNRLIATHRPPARRAGAIRVKQSGVQLGAFAAGLLLPAVAAAFSWRAALALVIPVALAAALWAFRLPADRAPSAPGGGLRLLPGAASPAARWLIGYSLGIGTGLAALNTYLPLYAHQELGLGQRLSGALIAALGAAGIAARVLWTRHSGRLTDVSRPLLLLAAASVGFAALVAASALWAPLVWPAALGLGGTAVAANAVSMVAVVRSPAFGATGHASALVSMGFFGGFVVGPLAFGALVDLTDGYPAGWALVALAFLSAAGCALGVRRALRS